jgi:hypothetical protein
MEQGGCGSVIRALPLPMNAGAESLYEPRQLHPLWEQEPELEGESLAEAAHRGRGT